MTVETHGHLQAGYLARIILQILLMHNCPHQQNLVHSQIKKQFMFGNKRYPPLPPVLLPVQKTTMGKKCQSVTEIKKCHSVKEMEGLFTDLS